MSTVSTLEKLPETETLRREIEHLADCGLGWEDVVVQMHREGRYVGKQFVRNIVLRKHGGPLQGQLREGL